MRDPVNAQPLWFEEIYREERARERALSIAGGAILSARAALWLSALSPVTAYAGSLSRLAVARLFGAAVPAAPAPPLKAQSSDGNHEAHPEAGCCIQTDCIQCVSRVLPEG